MSTPPINYTNRDFLTIKQSLIEIIKTKFPTTWKDFTESQIGIALLELSAYCFDVLSFYIDYQANETYLPTARDRASVLNLGRLVGYQLKPTRSATVTVKASKTVSNAVTIPAGTSVTAGSGLTFTTTDDQTLPLNQADTDITFVEGVPTTKTYEADGTAFQKFTLPDEKVIFNSVVVKVNGEEWSLIESLVYAEGDAKVFEVEWDEDCKATVRFGDNTSGMAPPAPIVPGTENIEITYRVGGGTVGNIPIGDIATTVVGWIDGNALNTTNVTVTNEEPGSGGQEPETVDHAKYWIPRWVRTNNRAVTESDYDTLATAFVSEAGSSVFAAKSRLKQEVPELNTVELFVWGTDENGDVTTVGGALKTALSAYFANNGTDAVRMICTRVEVLDGDIVYIDVICIATADGTLTASQTRTSVSDAVAAYFDSGVILPGEPVSLSKLYNAIQNAGGVRNALIVNIIASKKLDFTDTSFSAGTSYSATLPVDTGREIVPSSVVVKFMQGSTVALTVTDDGVGGWSGHTGTIDYVTGAIVIGGFSLSGVTSVETAYRQILSYYREETIQSSSAELKYEFVGTVQFPPVIPYNSGQDGILFSTVEGPLNVIDDGDGNLKFVATGETIGSIDYSSGAYRFTLPYGITSKLVCAYNQLLRSPSEDIPITKYQLPVLARTSVTVNVQ